MLRASVDDGLGRPVHRAAGRIQIPGKHSISHGGRPGLADPHGRGWLKLADPRGRGRIQNDGRPASRDHTSHGLPAFDLSDPGPGPRAAHDAR